MIRRPCPALVLLLLAACTGGQAWAGGASAADRVVAAQAQDVDDAPWLQPVAGDYPIRRMSSLKSEYRRIRELRRAQIQPEYERRAAEGEDADAWREATLREVARRDLRDLRARLDR
ncbi:hypothetical protein [Luteimonas deserti]|uniref:hypothetical protein n=1 Tax=Luteimonas deserti TaxID=2752306 RepID=UPI001C5CBD82|nr:hypothetical protein [Luteimonas deserti]